MSEPTKCESTMEKRESELNDKTKIPLGIVVVCIASFIGGATWINNSLSEIRHELNTIKLSIANQFTASDMKIWVLQLKMENPSLKVPSVEAHGR